MTPLIGLPRDERAHSDAQAVAKSFLDQPLALFKARSEANPGPETLRQALQELSRNGASAKLLAASCIADETLRDSEPQSLNAVILAEAMLVDCLCMKEPLPQHGIEEIVAREKEAKNLARQFAKSLPILLGIEPPTKGERPTAWLLRLYREQEREGSACAASHDSEQQWRRDFTLAATRLCLAPSREAEVYVEEASARLGKGMPTRSVLCWEAFALVAQILAELALPADERDGDEVGGGMNLFLAIREIRTRLGIRPRIHKTEGCPWLEEIGARKALWKVRHWPPSDARWSPVRRKAQMLGAELGWFPDWLDPFRKMPRIPAEKSRI